MIRDKLCTVHASAASLKFAKVRIFSLCSSAFVFAGLSAVSKLIIVVC